MVSPEVLTCSESSKSLAANIFINAKLFFKGVWLAPSTTCEPSQCGPNSECKMVTGFDTAICYCLEGFIGASPNCKRECSISKDCGDGLACISNKCEDPCPGLCGLKAFCDVKDHVPICKCLENYYGNPYERCKSESEAENDMFADPIVMNVCETNPAACQ